MNYLRRMPPAILDMWIYVGIAFFGAWGVAFGTDEAGKFIELKLLFWLKAACASIGGSLLAAKMFRSTAFAEHEKYKKDTAFLTQHRPAP